MLATRNMPRLYSTEEKQGNGLMKMLPQHAGPCGIMDKGRISDFMKSRSMYFSDESMGIIASAGNVLRLYKGRDANNFYKAQMREALGDLIEAVKSYDNKLQDAVRQMQQVREKALEAAEQESHQSQHPDPSLPQARLLFEEEMTVLLGMSHGHNNIIGPLQMVADVLLKAAGSQPDSEPQYMGMIEQMLGRFDNSFFFMANMKPSEVELKPYIKGMIFAEVEPPAKESK